MALHAELANDLEPHEEIRFATLFGSRAEGSPREDSDIDLAVYLDPSLSAEARWELRLRLAAALERHGAVDLIVLNEAPPLLAYEALCGDLVLDRDRKAYVRFYAKTMTMAFDREPVRRLFSQARRRRLRESRFGRS